MSHSVETGVDVEREYRAGREAAALVTLARGTLDVSGPKRQDFLHAMLSNEVNGLRPGQGCRAASMSAKGALQALLRVLVDTTVVVLEAETERLELVHRTLEHHKGGAPVRFAPGNAVVLASFGPRAAETVRAAGAATRPGAGEDHPEGGRGDATGGERGPREGRARWHSGPDRAGERPPRAGLRAPRAEGGRRGR